MVSTNKNFDTRFLKMQDYPAAMKFLHKFFYRDEPMNTAVDLYAHENSVKELELYTSTSLKYNCSIIATNKTGEIVGICLNKLRSQVEEDGPEFVDPVFGKIAGILDRVDKDLTKIIYDKYPDIGKYIQIDILSVDNTLRGQGIAKKLIDVTRDVAKEMGLKMIRIDCSSEYSARAAARMGFQSIYELKFSDYKINGEQVIRPATPHTQIAVYIQMLDGSGLSPKL